MSGNVWKIRASASLEVGRLVFVNPDGAALPTSFRIQGRSAVQLKAAEGAGPKRLRRFEMLAYDGGALRLPNVPHPVVVDLQGLTVPDESLPILRDHDIGRVVGHSETIAVSASDIRISGVISGASEASQEVLAAADNQFPWRASIGADATVMELFQRGERVQVNGQWFDGPVYVARSAELKESSFVSLGAARKTSAKIAASAKGGMSMQTFEEYVASLGFDLAALSPEQTAALQSAFATASTPTTVAAAAEGAAAPAATAVAASGTGGLTATLPTVAKLREEYAIEAKRIADVITAAGDCVEIKAKAIAEGWDAMKTENAVLRASRPPGGPYFSMGSTGGDVDAKVIQAALCMTGKLNKPEDHFDPKTLEIAAKHCKGWGLQRVIIHHAGKNGWRGDGLSAFQQGNVSGLLRAAFSTLDLSDTLGGSSEKFARQGIRSTIGMVWRQFSSIVSVKDFRPTDGRSLIEANAYIEVGPGAPIAHGTLSESSWTNRAKSFARMLAITFQDQRNDDLGFLASADKLLGRGASRSINTQWFTEFMDNSSFFTSGRGNYSSGGGTALSATSLATAERLFKAQTTEEGDDVDFEASYLFVPLALDVTARELHVSTNWNTGGSSSTEKVAQTNIWAGKFMPVTASQLSNSSFTGYSTTAWYLLADPADAPVVEVAFLDGKEEPTIETAEADFNTLGIQMRGHIHYGVAKAEYRAGVKMAGA